MLKNWPTILALFASSCAPAVIHLGWLTSDQVAALGVIVAPIFAALVHRLAPPVKA